MQNFEFYSTTSFQFHAPTKIPHYTHLHPLIRSYGGARTLIPACHTMSPYKPKALSYLSTPLLLKFIREPMFLYRSSPCIFIKHLTYRFFLFPTVIIYDKISFSPLLNLLTL